LNIFRPYLTLLTLDIVLVGGILESAKNYEGFYDWNVTVFHGDSRSFCHAQVAIQPKSKKTAFQQDNSGMEERYP